MSGLGRYRDYQRRRCTDMAVAGAVMAAKRYGKRPSGRKLEPAEVVARLKARATG